MAELAHIRYFTEIMDDRTYDLRAVLDLLQDVGADYTLIGAVAVGHHGRPRATLDVDMIVPGRFLGWIADAARERGYVVTTPLHMVRIYPRGSDPQKDESIADFLSAHANPVLQAAFRESEPVEILGEQVQVVTRGALVALKFHSAVSKKRKVADKHQDIADIGRIIEKKFDAEDAATARRIAALSYPGAGKDLDRLVNNLRHGLMTLI